MGEENGGDCVDESEKTVDITCWQVDLDEDEMKSLGPQLE